MKVVHDGACRSSCACQYGPLFRLEVHFLYNTAKGYGFIEPDDGSKDVFVHASALERAGIYNLTEGQKVSFDIEVNQRTGKPAAANLRVE